MADDKSVGLSFAFAKKKTKIQLANSVIGEKQDTGSGDEADYIKVIEGKEVKSVKPKEEKKEIVIPLIQVNRWRHAVRPEDLEKKTDKIIEKSADHSKAAKTTLVGSKVVESADQQAANEILADVARTHKAGETGETDFSIPLLMRNKVPEGFETDDQLNVSLRPEEPDPADYDRVPIDDFGFAMLRGMGWKTGQGLGKNNEVIAPIQAVARPKGLGLGADRSALLQKNGETKGNMTNNDDDDNLVLEKGAYCLIMKGKHKDHYGVVEGLDEDNAQVMVKLTLSRNMATASQYVVKLVSKKEYDKYSKYLNKAQVDRYKEEESKKQAAAELHRSTESKDESTHTKHSSDHHHHHHRKRKHDHERSDKSSEHKSKHSSNGSGRHKKLWLQSNLRVRIVDSHYMNGKYFKNEVVIVDVIDTDNCICRTDSEQLLEGLSQSMLETVIPKSEPGYVLIVEGRHRGQLAEILKKDKQAYIATVQLLSDRDKLLDISFDDICEYTGDIDLEMDY
ncbi:hypothetical protein NP493_173g04014 [Ridgeia piscesae]|uniref:G-patch domain-containing protein n=1 Tax=Ridgeia piscesae TaxID=27915 RepID=A0AAD9UFA1_RIDPI|nr:hypothetical protein NP493_173g04014 [Ridgeia piscesae]